MPFIGDLEVKEVKPVFSKEGFVNLVLEDGSEKLINEELYKLLVTEERGVGNMTDNVRDFFARKFISELSQYDLNFYFADSIGIAMATLAHNLREELIRKTFGCSGGSDISLKLLVDNAVSVEAENEV